MNQNLFHARCLVFTYLVRSKAVRPFSGLLSAKSVEIDKFFSFEPQVPLRIYPNALGSFSTSIFWHWNQWTGKSLLMMVKNLKEHSIACKLCQSDKFHALLSSAISFNSLWWCRHSVTKAKSPCSKN